MVQRTTPSYRRRQVYKDQDGEAASASAGVPQDRPMRILIPIIAIVALALSASIVVLLDFETTLCIITSGWVCLSAFLEATCSVW